MTLYKCHIVTTTVAVCFSRQVDEVRGTVRVSHPNTASTDPPKAFTFDTTFGETCKQVDIYNEVARPIIEFVLKGYNGQS